MRSLLPATHDSAGVALVVATVLLDQIGLPIPAGPVLVVAGAAAIGHLGWGLDLYAGSVAASVLADSVWYWSGRLYGNRVMRLLCRISLNPDSCVSATQLRFERWGGKALLVAKFIPGLAIIAPPLAGALRMRVRRFLALSVAGAALWVGCFVGLGMLLEPQIRRLWPRAAGYGRGLGWALGALLAGFIAYKWWERRQFYAMLRMARIGVDELYGLMEAQRAPVVVDVRSHSARAVEPRWIPGAVHVPTDRIGEHLASLPREREIVLYCSCPNEASAARVAKILIDQGFTRVRPLQGGLEAWVSAGYPVDETPQPAAL